MLEFDGCIAFAPHANNLQQVVLYQPHLAQTPRYLSALLVSCGDIDSIVGRGKHIIAIQFLVVELQPAPQVLEARQGVVAEGILATGSSSNSSGGNGRGIVDG